MRLGRFAATRYDSAVSTDAGRPWCNPPHAKLRPRPYVGRLFRTGLGDSVPCALPIAYDAAIVRVVDILICFGILRKCNRVVEDYLFLINFLHSWTSCAWLRITSLKRDKGLQISFFRVNVEGLSNMDSLNYF